ncbi:hypothetical protein CYMTET_14135 [Cymbomonas tetramitiformis]|uniref:Uncharacterized protein n=1 Tax=Cymbomonas tetramitiformis TaxID=36881 RepID=A0AAE0GGZ1_9CHLO|nr:hypothetical protein CYMTET_14135 [Cymbomonas tetramitiformis]
MVAAAVVYDIALLVTLQAVPVGSVSLPQAVFSFPSGGNVLVQFTLSAENRLLLSGIGLHKAECKAYPQYANDHHTPKPYKSQASRDPLRQMSALNHTPGFVLVLGDRVELPPLRRTRVTSNMTVAEVDVTMLKNMLLNSRDPDSLFFHCQLHLYLNIGGALHISLEGSPFVLWVVCAAVTAWAAEGALTLRRSILFRMTESFRCEGRKGRDAKQDDRVLPDDRVLVDLNLGYDPARARTLIAESAYGAPGYLAHILSAAERFEVHFPRLDARASVRDPSSGSSGSLDLSITAEGFAVELLSVLNGSAASSTVPISAACQILTVNGRAESCVSAGAAAAARSVARARRGRALLEMDHTHESHPGLDMGSRIQRLLDHAMQGQGHAGRGLLHDGGGSSIADEMAALLTTLQPENVLKVGLMCDNLICDFGNAIAETNLNLFVSDHDLVLGLEMGEYLNMSVQAVAAEVTADDEVASAADERVYLLWDVARDGESVSRMEGRLTRSRQQDAATLHVEYWDANHAASVDAGGRAPLLDVYLSGSRASERWSELHSRQLEGDHMRLLARVNQSGEELVDVDMAMGVAVDPDNYWDLFMYAESLAVYEGRRHLEVSNCSAMLNAVDSEDEYAGRMDGVLTCTAQPGVDPSGGLWGTTTVPRRYTLSSEMRLTEVDIALASSSPPPFLPPPPCTPPPTQSPIAYPTDSMVPMISDSDSDSDSESDTDTDSDRLRF